MMDELTVPLKRSFSDLIFGIYGNDLKEVVDSLEEMDVIRKVSVRYISISTSENRLDMRTDMLRGFRESN